MTKPPLNLAKVLRGQLATPNKRPYHGFMQRSTKVTLAAVLFSAVLAACGGSSSSEPVVIPATVDLEVRAVSGLKFDASSYTTRADDSHAAPVSEFPKALYYL